MNSVIAKLKPAARQLQEVAQYDYTLAYVGHAEHFDKVEIDGTLAARDCKLTYSRDGKRLAVAVVHRDLEGLRCEVEFEPAIAASA